MGVLNALAQNRETLSHRSSFSRFSKFQGETIGVAPDTWGTNFLCEIVFGMVMKRTIIFELEAECSELLNYNHRIETAPDRTIIRLHMTTRVINNPIDAPRF